MRIVARAQGPRGTRAWSSWSGRPAGREASAGHRKPSFCLRHAAPNRLRAEQVKEETILATMYARPGDYDQAWDPDVHYVTSDDWFGTINTHVRCGNMFEIIGK